MDNRTIQQHLRAIIEQTTNLLEALAGKSETPEMQVAREKAAKGLCCFCGEVHGDDVIYRGDHQKCYKRVWRAIHGKEITEEQAVRRGWMLEAETGGRKSDPSDPISQFIAEKATPKQRKKRQ